MTCKDYHPAKTVTHSTITRSSRDNHNLIPLQPFNTKPDSICVSCEQFNQRAIIFLSCTKN